MKWLKRKLRNWINDYDNEDVLKLTASCDVEAQMCDAEPILNFRVFSAVGGQVVEFRRYDRKIDRSDTTTYIIHKEDDFGDKISKIANLELLK
jgi:hypothetical protein